MGQDRCEGDERARRGRRRRSATAGRSGGRSRPPPAGVPCPSSSATSVWAGMASASSARARNSSRPAPIWWAASVASSTRAAIAVAPTVTASIDPTRSRRWRPAVISGAMPGPARPALRGPGEVPAHDDGERHAGADLGDDGRPRRARHAPLEAVDEQHLEHGVDGVRREQDDERRAVVRRAALDALGAEGEHDERDPERADAQVRRAERQRRRRRRRGRRPATARRGAISGATTMPTIADSHIVCTATFAAPVAVGRRRSGGRRARSCRRSGSCTPRRRGRARSPPGPARRAAPCRGGRRSPCRRGCTAARRRGCRAPAGRGR